MRKALTWAYALVAVRRAGFRGAISQIYGKGWDGNNVQEMVNQEGENRKQKRKKERDILFSRCS